MTKVSEQEKEIELHRLKNIAGSFLWLNLGIIVVFIIFLMLVGAFKSLKYWAILFFIIPYYLNIVRIHKFNVKTIKYIFVNILSISAIYNILLTFNNFIFNMIELSSNYLVSNIAYFYISFLIITFNYKFYNKISFMVDIFFGLVLKAKSNPFYIITLTFFSSLIIISVITTIMSILNFDNMMMLKTLFIMSGSVILLNLISMIYYVASFNYKDYTHENHKLLKNWLVGFENIINKFTDWFIEIFKIDKIENGEIINNKGKLNVINAITLLISKFVPIIILLFLISSNAYYATYAYKNNGYCENTEKVNILNNNSKIIELRNGDILFIYDTYKVKQYKCKLKPIDFKLKTEIIQIEKNKDISI